MSAKAKPSALSIVRLTAVAATLLLGLGLAGCSGDDDTDDSSSKSTPSAAIDAAAGEDTGEGSASDNGNDTDSNDTDGDGDRAFGSDDDAVISAVLAATDADRAEWEGKTLVVHFNEGSASDPMSGTKCGAAIVLADDEKAIMRFPDGEIDCSER